MAKRLPRLAVAEAFDRGILEGAKPLVERWAHFLDLADAPEVKDPVDRYVLASMLESTQSVLTKEAASMNTTTVFGSAYVSTMLGMARQIFPRAFGQRLVSVQPMDRPTGQVFYLKTMRDDASTLGVFPKDDNASLGYSEYIASKAYADHAGGEGGEIAKGMTLSIESAPVSITKVKKLKTSATWELQTDLAAYHSLNAMDLLQGAAVDEIAQELDAEIVSAVRAAAIAHKTVTFGPAPTSYPVELWPKRVQRAILEADKSVFLSSGRHPNVMVCGIDALIELMDLSNFTMAPNADWENSGYGVTPVGSLDTRYEVYLSRSVPDDEILLGRRGAGFLDAGIVYAPYVALFITDRFFDVSLQKTIQSFASRYDILTLSNTLYARVRLDENAAAGIN